jgi:type II secretion system protein G
MTNPRTQSGSLTITANPPGTAAIRGLLFLLLLVSVLVLPFTLYPPCSASRARHISAATQIICFDAALRAFHEDNGFYPPGTNGLQDLVVQPPGATNWQGPYLDSDAVPKDPWARAYIYLCPGKRVPAYPYDLYSLGPPGANEPIANWSAAP